MNTRKNEELTLINLLWIEGKIEHWLRFGNYSYQQRHFCFTRLAICCCALEITATSNAWIHIGALSAFLLMRFLLLSVGLPMIKGQWFHGWILSEPFLLDFHIKPFPMFNQAGRSCSKCVGLRKWAVLFKSAEAA